MRDGPTINCFRGSPWIELALFGIVGIVWAAGCGPPIPSAPGPTGGIASAAATSSRCHEVGGLSDPVCTPGAVNPDVTQATIGSTICVPGWTATVRPPTSYTAPLKLEGIRAYGYADTAPADYEEDHLVPLELGGSPRSVLNLWPEPRYGPHPAADKDAVENRLHADVCAGRLSLATAQVRITLDWIHG